jgi:hypothetical protein
MFKSAKMALAIAKHSVMGGTYTLMGGDGNVGILIDVPLRKETDSYDMYRGKDILPYSCRISNINKFASIYYEEKMNLFSSLPVPTHAVTGIGFYGCRPAMGIFLLTEGETFIPFSDTSPVFNKLILTDEAGLMMKWLSQEYEEFTAYPFVTVQRITTAWAPMVAFFQHLGESHGDYESAAARLLESKQGKITAQSCGVEQILKAYQAALARQTRA